MKIFGFEISFGRKAASTISINTLIQRLEDQYRTASGATVTPETCMQAPTVHALVTAIARRIALMPIKVYQKTTSNGRDAKEVLPNHPVTKLLQMPNTWQDSVTFWLDATSQLIRYGNFIAYKSRGSTGPVRQLLPVIPYQIVAEQDENWDVIYRVTLNRSGEQVVWTPEQVLHARGIARNGYWGDSPIIDIREAIALEIQAERMGGSVFGNSALPGLVFAFGDGHAGFKTEEERSKFVKEFDAAYGSRRNRFASMLLPKGIELRDPIQIDNEKAQFLATRQYQRSVIAGAFGVPPHLVGDLSKGTFNNVEMQSIEFIVNVVLPFVRIFETAMERSLLTDEDRRAGRIIRFNIEGTLRGDFKTRQEGLKIQREMGVISSNDWREVENMNPLPPEDGGETYWTKGPSGQGTDDPGSEDSAAKPNGAVSEDEEDEPAIEA